MTAMQRTSNADLSLVSGPTTPSLWTKTVLDVLRENVLNYGSYPAVIVPWQRHRSTFNNLNARSSVVAKALLSLGVNPGQHVGIMAGNRYEYIDIFLGSARIGCPVVVLNNTYTVEELVSAVDKTNCHVVFIAQQIGRKDTAEHMRAISNLATKPDTALDIVVAITDGPKEARSTGGIMNYKVFLEEGRSTSVSSEELVAAERKVKAKDVLNIQLTSGTTGSPKAAMLSHHSLVNNGFLVGNTMRLTTSDIVCCPPPLFHCFGLVMGFLATLAHGCAIVFASDVFDGEKALDAIVQEGCTALYGVPTMITAIIEVARKRKIDICTLRTGLAAGTLVPAALMQKVEQQLNCNGMLIAYGMTETSPVTFMTSMDDPERLRHTSVGQVMPHTGAKIIDGHGLTLPRGERGELCTSGYALQIGYYQNEAKTREVMSTDEDGVRWMRTGDVGYLDNDGYAFITGRVKDIIIRGGENIYPGEIEDRLLLHAGISEASVVAIKDEKYGEVVGAFLRSSDSVSGHPSDEDVRKWVMETLGRHKAPRYFFWLGEAGVPADFPKTGSGKHKKHVMSALGSELVRERRATQAKL